MTKKYLMRSGKTIKNALEKPQKNFYFCDEMFDKPIDGWYNRGRFVLTLK